MDSFVYDIEHTILIEEMNPSIWPYIYMSSLFALWYPPNLLATVFWKLKVCFNSSTSNNYTFLFHTAFAIG